MDGPAGRIAYRRRGDGDPLVLLHPLALSGAVWEPVVDLLANRYDVIAPDARGHGASGWDGAPFDVGDMADDLIALLDGLGLPQVHLLGMSMGGSVAIDAAGRHPDRVRTLGLADTTAWYGDDAVPAWNERADRVLATSRADQVPFQVDRWFTERFRRERTDEVQRVVTIFVGTGSEAHAHACRALGAMDGRALLDRITAPTLAFAGEEDYATPPEMGRAVADGVARGRAMTLPALRHLSMIEAPRLAELAAAHIEGRPLPDPAALQTVTGAVR
ncbi:alpha/beta fold hydrolase [Pseudonocardia endophytica]|uniref:alpha/beta fold hydrolase n=1 Tax=Pseudonocardia endophytica TaxID=401976 RepID=UPI001FB4EB67|nr:alpha/beta fold hydrolase [Pseudonocardia endophytica]